MASFVSKRFFCGLSASASIWRLRTSTMPLFSFRPATCTNTKLRQIRFTTPFLPLKSPSTISTESPSRTCICRTSSRVLVRETMFFFDRISLMSNVFTLFCWSSTVSDCVASWMMMPTFAPGSYASHTPRAPTATRSNSSKPSTLTRPLFTSTDVTM